MERLKEAGAETLIVEGGDPDAVARAFASFNRCGALPAVRDRRPAIDAAPALRIIAKHGTGVDNVDVAAATRRDIP
jgi:D-3-phosphoglycerate dehydrogenase